MISLKATNEISQIEWNDIHSEGESILKDFLQSGKYSQYCVNRMNSDVDKESSSMSRKMGLEDSFHFENSVTSLRWSLYISADMIGDKERAWSHLINAHDDGNKNNHYDFHKKKTELKRAFMAGCGFTFKAFGRTVELDLETADELITDMGNQLAEFYKEEINNIEVKGETHV